MFRINAGAAEEKQLAHPVFVGGMDQVVLDLQIFEEELDRPIVVRLDSAYLCRRHDDDRRLFAGKEFLDSPAIRQVKFDPGAGQQPGETLRSQLPN